MANVDERRAETDDLKTLMDYVEVVNKLAERLERLTKGREIYIKSPVLFDPSKLSDYYYVNYIKKFMENKVDFRPRFHCKCIEVSMKYAKSWGYLILGNLWRQYYEVKLVGRVDLNELLALYRMYEEGLLREIMREVEMAIPKLKKEESRLKKMSVILEMLGIPQA